MKRSRLLSLFALLVPAASLGVIAPGCGGGGSGGGGGCFLPGTLVAFAIEGGAAPGVGGTYGPLPATTPLTVADGGWTAFVAPVVGGSSTLVLFVVTPSGVVTPVFGVGDAVPAPGASTIDDFQNVFVTSGGVVVTLADRVGGGFAILTALVSAGGTVSEKATAYVDGQALPPGPGALNPGTLTTLDASLFRVDDQGDVFFVAGGSGGAFGVWTTNRSGSTHTAVAVTGDAAPGGGTYGLVFDGLGIDGDGLLVAFSANLLGTVAADGVFATNGPQTQAVAREGTTVPGFGGATYDKAFGGGALVVTLQSGIGFVTFGAQTSATPSNAIVSRQVAPNLGTGGVIVGPGLSAPNTGVGAIFGAVALLESANDPQAVGIRADVIGGTTTQQFFSSTGVGSRAEILREGQLAPDTSVFFTTDFPSISTTDGVPEISRDGSFGFAAELSDGITCLWWAIRGCDMFLIAAEGGTAPDVGGTFSVWPVGSRVVVANGAFVFQSDVAGGSGATALFRQK